MSSTINNGSQNLTFDYRQEGTSEGFNKLLYTLIPQGILKGGNLSINSGLIVNIAPMTCYFKDETNEVGVRIETRENATVTLSQAKPYVVGEFTWINTEDNFMEFKAVDLPSDDQIVFGRGIFASVNTISGFDTTYKTWSKEYYENINEDGTPSFKVTVNPNNQLKLDVGKGHAIINGKEVTFTNTVTSGEINTNVSNARIDYLCITENGALTFVSSEDVSVPTNPSIPYNMLAIAKITLPSNPTSILGKVEYIYNNHQQTPSVDSIISTISSNYDTLNNAKQDKITNTVQTSQPTDSNYVGGFTNSSTSTNPTSHNSWTFTNVWNWVKTHLGVRSGSTDSAIGSSVKPVYCNSAGKLIALSDNNANVNLGSNSSANLFSSSPSFGVTGILGVANGGTGASTLTSGALLQGNGTGAITKASSVGSTTTPIYIDSNGKAKTVSVDSTPTLNSDNLITSGGVYDSEINNVYEININFSNDFTYVTDTPTFDLSIPSEYLNNHNFKFNITGGTKTYTSDVSKIIFYLKFSDNYTYECHLPIKYIYYDSTNSKYSYSIPSGIFKLTKYSDYGILYLMYGKMYFIMDNPFPYAVINIYILNNFIIKTEIKRGTNSSTETIKYNCEYTYDRTTNLLAINASGVYNVANDGDYIFEISAGSKTTVIL